MVAFKVIANILVLLSFTTVYLLMGMKEHFAFATTTKPSALTSLYFAMTTHTTSGYGDIYPKSNLSKSVVMAHMALVWFIALAL